MPFGLIRGHVAAIGAGVSAAGSLGAAYMQSQSAKGAQSAAQGQFAQQQANVAPWVDTGTQSLHRQHRPARPQRRRRGNQGDGQLHDLAGLPVPVGPGAARGGRRGGGTGHDAIRGHDQGRGSVRSGAREPGFHELLQSAVSPDFPSSAPNTATGGATTAANSAQASLAGANAQNSILGNDRDGPDGRTANSLLNNKDFQNWAGIGTTPSTPGLSSSQSCAAQRWTRNV